MSARKLNHPLAVILVAMLGMCPLLAHAQTGNTKVPAKGVNANPVTAQAAPQGLAPGVIVTQAFTQRGVAKCAERIGQFAQFLTNGAQVGGQVFVAPDDADRRVASASLEIQAPGSAIAYAGLTFAPDSGTNRCGGVYELVSYWANTCEDVATKQYPTFKRANPLRQSIIVLEGVQTKRIFLMSTGTGCVTIIKETVY